MAITIDYRVAMLSHDSIASSEPEPKGPRAAIYPFSS